MKKLLLILVIPLLMGVGYVNKQDNDLNNKIAEPDETYLACGCGCCGNNDIETICLYKSEGDDLQKIIEKNRLSANNTSFCASVGCSTGVLYKYCDETIGSYFLEDKNIFLEWDSDEFRTMISKTLIIPIIAIIIFIIFVIRFLIRIKQIDNYKYKNKVFWISFVFNILFSLGMLTIFLFNKSIIPSFVLWFYLGILSFFFTYNGVSLLLKTKKRDTVAIFTTILPVALVLLYLILHIYRIYIAISLS